MLSIIRRNSKRDLERRLTDLEPAVDGRESERKPEIVVAHRTPTTDELTDRAGEEVAPPAVHGPGRQLIVIKDSVVMVREQAHAEGHEVRGPATEAAEGAGAVRVAVNAGCRERAQEDGEA